MRTHHQGSTTRSCVLAACMIALAACGGEESAPNVPAPAPTPSEAAVPAPAPAPAEPAPPAPAPEGAQVASPGLPADVPGYPGAKAVASSQDGEEGLIIAFETGDEPEKIYQFYKDAFVEQGWALEGEMSSADQRMVIAGKDVRRASVMVSVEGGKTEFTVTVTKDEG